MEMASPPGPGMSTFDSVVNAGAAYWAHDVYGAFLAGPARDERALMWHRCFHHIPLYISMVIPTQIKQGLYSHLIR